MGVFYPSFVVNMALRFDESFNVNEDKSPAGADVQSLATGQPVAFGPPKIRPLILAGGRDALTQVVGRIPRTATVELNGIRQAHTFDMTFNFRDLPVDPRLIRQARVEIFVGVIRPEAFARGMTSVNSDGTRDSILSPRQSRTPTSRLLFVGLLDEAEVEHGEHGSFVHMRGRDLRGELIDAKVDPRTYTKLDLTQSIDKVVLQILHKSPFGSGINVYVQKADWPNGNIPSPATSDGLTRVRRGADGNGALSSPMGEGDKIGFWDLITKYCFLVGAAPYFIGKDLQIRPVASLYDQIAFDGTRPTPFAGGQVRKLKTDSPVGTSSKTNKTENIRIRRFVYGRDILSVKFARKFRGQKTPVIEVVSVDTSSNNRGLKKLLIARFPAKTATATDSSGLPIKTIRDDTIANAEKTSVAPSGQAAQTEPYRIAVPGLKSQKQALEIARNLYQEIGRNELGGSAITHDFASFNTDDDQDPDMIGLMPGDAVQFVVDRRILESRQPAVSEWQRQMQMSFDEHVRDLEKTLGRGDRTRADSNLARVLVATQRNSIVELQDTFRTKNVRITKTEEGAISWEFDFENYIEVRSGAVNPRPAQSTAAPTGKSS